MNIELIVGAIFISVCVFTYQHAYVKTKRVSTQAQLLLLQNKLRDELVDKENEFDDDKIKTFLMVDDGLNKAYHSLTSLTLSAYVKHIITTHQVDSLKSNNDRKSRFLTCLDKANSPLLISIVHQADTLLYQQLKVNTLLAMLMLLPFTFTVWLLIGISKATKESHHLILRTLTINTFWSIQ